MSHSKFLVTVVINITGNRLFQLGETARIICSTPVPVQSIEWVNQSNRILTSVQELELSIMITTSSNNTRYTCAASDGGGFMESETITIHVQCKQQ